MIIVVGGSSSVVNPNEYLSIFPVVKCRHRSTGMGGYTRISNHERRKAQEKSILASFCEASRPPSIGNWNLCGLYFAIEILEH
jgi:hypothetical protein